MTLKFRWKCKSFHWNVKFEAEDIADLLRSLYWVSQKKVLRLMNNKTKGFCSIFRISFVLNKIYPNLDFEIKIAEIR